MDAFYTEYSPSNTISYNPSKNLETHVRGVTLPAGIFRCKQLPRDKFI